MKENQFKIAKAGVPIYYAVFKVKFVPGHIRCTDLEVGDLMYWNDFRSQMVRLNNSMCQRVEASDLDFVAYMTTAQMQETTHVTNA